MKLINHHVEMWHQQPGTQGIYNMIEAAGKVTHETDPKGGEVAKAFTERMIQNGHLAMLEFGTVYLRFSSSKAENIRYGKYPYPYSREWMTLRGNMMSNYVSTNLRVIRENGWREDMEFVCEPTKHHEKRYTFKIYTDRAVSHELVRHRAFSFAQESQRFCNYSQGRFGGEVTFVIPHWLKGEITDGASFNYDEWIDRWQASEYPDFANFMQSIAFAEKNYLTLLHNDIAPQDARGVLPNAAKTEIVMCGFESDWKHFLDLRYRGTTGAPHPDMLDVATQIHDLFEAEGIDL